MMIFLDRQHLGKPNRWNDEGAKNDEMTETYLTSQYIFHAENHLRMHDIDVCVLSDGWYSDRHARVNEYCRTGVKSVYVACHINAGVNGTYGASFYDYRSSGGKILSECINRHLDLHCSELSSVKAIPAQPDDWTAHAFNTIKNVGQPTAVCFEPFFIDAPSHALLKQPSGIHRVGIALAEGILEFIKQ